MPMDYNLLKKLIIPYLIKFFIFPISYIGARILFKYLGIGRSSLMLDLYLIIGFVLAYILMASYKIYREYMTVTKR